MASIVRLDKIQASYNGNLESVRHTAVLENGMVFFAGALIAGERELKNVAVADANNITQDTLLLHATPEMMYDGTKGLKDFSVAIGKEARAYVLQEGDIFTVTADGLGGTLALNNFVAPVAGNLRLQAGTVYPTTKFVGKIIEVTKLGFDGAVAYAIQVIKA